MPSRRHPIHVPYLVDRLRTVPPKDLADAADADSLNQSFNSIMSELHRYLRYLQDADDAGLPAGAFTGTPTDLVVGALAILGDPELGWIGGGHTHGVPSGSPALLGAILADGVGLAFSRNDHVHKRDLLFRLNDSDVAVRGASNFLDSVGVTFSVVDDPGNDEVEISVALAPGALPQMTRVELDFGTPAVVEKVFTVVDAAITPASRIIMTHSGAAATGKQADEAEFDAIDCRCEPGTGDFKVYATSLLGHVLGPFQFDYVAQ
ncbi:MAG TPA: hypothetical protein VMZ92_02800 [Planctomycetota bacterium]|nr:hypothetical protein [Planctomycetota bacterium]